MVRRALRKSSVIKDQLGARALSIQLKSHDGKDPRIPYFFAPGLDKPLVGNHLEVASDDAIAEQGKLPSEMWADDGGCARSG
jgi:hypothetical protein